MSPLRRPREFRKHSRRWLRTDTARALISSLVATALSVVAFPALNLVVPLDREDTLHLAVATFVTLWPIYTVVYVWWGIRAYRPLSTAELAATAREEVATRNSLLQRFLGTSSLGNILVLAASMAVVVTIVIAQRPEFRGEPILIALGLLTVACSWGLMVFTFAQAYMRLDIPVVAAAGTDRTERAHLRFTVDGSRQFIDYLTQALMVSTMAVAAPAEAVSREAWRVVRTNTLVAFAFNSVIIAMMVSLLFGGISA